MLSAVSAASDKGSARLDGGWASHINADLTGTAADLTRAQKLAENVGVAFMGDTKGGAFDIPGDLARAWLKLPSNPNGRSNADVLRPWRNGLDVTRRSRDMWIIDFGDEMSEQAASYFEAPFGYVSKYVQPERAKNRREAYRLRWWRHVEPRPSMWAALARGSRYIATPTVAKHRLFIRLDRGICPDHQLIAIARDDDVTFGILHSRFHEVWSLALGTSLEDRPRYTPTSTFETFPFPEGLTPNIPAVRSINDPRAIAIAEAARRLDDLRKSWLNPLDLVRIESEVVPGYPDRVLPKDAAAELALRDRTLTNLYNQRPQWLMQAHRDLDAAGDLDAAVAAAYGWDPEIPVDGMLTNLLKLNLSRPGASSKDGAKATRHNARGEPELKYPLSGGKQAAENRPAQTERVSSSPKGQSRRRVA